MLNVLINFVFFVKLRWFLRERECFGRGELEEKSQAFEHFAKNIRVNSFQS